MVGPGPPLAELDGEALLANRVRLWGLLSPYTHLAFFPGCLPAACSPLAHKRTSGRWGTLALVGPVPRSTMTWPEGRVLPSWWNSGIWSSCSTTGNGR